MFHLNRPVSGRAILPRYYKSGAQPWSVWRILGGGLTSQILPIKITHVGFGRTND